MSTLTAVSLFAGIGGFDLALERAGVKVVAAVEIDPGCRSVLRRHFPRATIFDDVTEVTGDQLRAAGFVPGRGIVCGGWPCQGNSVAGRRGGMADPRSGLWRHVVRLADELNPAWLLLENVPGLLSVNEGRDFQHTGSPVLGSVGGTGIPATTEVPAPCWCPLP
jgi:DNA (cytosine-5)-methyltransferase 1